MKHKIASTFLAFLVVAGYAIAADSKKEAHVTQIIRDVKLLPASAAAREAVMNDRVAEDTGVRTGGDSRSELTFADLTITRLGANTIFSFNRGGRNDQVDSGSILLRVPKDSGGGRVKTSAVTVAVTGTTFILESTRGGRNKLIVLEGGARLSLVKYPRQSQIAHGGQMIDVPPGATTVPPPINIDLNQVMRTHPLITDFPPLPSRNLIVAASQQSPPSGPVVFPVSPVVDLLGGGNNNPPHGTYPNPPGRPLGNPPGKPPTRPPHAGPGEGTGAGSTNPGATPPPVITRQPPGGHTKVPPPPPPTANSYVPKPAPTPARHVPKKTSKSAPH